MNGEGQRTGLERRRSVRLAVPPFGATVSVVGAQLVDLSTHGALIESLVPMEVDAVLPFRLVIVGAKHDIEARVVRCQAVPGAKRRYRVGLDFVRLRAEVGEQLALAAREGLGGGPATA